MVSDPLKHVLPPLSFVGNAAHAFQKFEADGSLDSGADHVSFKLSASGESLVLSTANGVLIDGISFGPQMTGISQGRLPDGGRTVVAFSLSASPGSSNYLPFVDNDGDGLADGWETANGLDPNDRADAFYVEWARQCLSGAMADMIFVSTGADGRLLGYLAFRRREPVSTTGGVPVFGGGLGACRPDAPGAYAGLIRAGTVWAHDHDGVAECQTQNYNFPVIRVYEAVGAHYVRAEYTLHRWLS